MSSRRVSASYQAQGQPEQLDTLSQACLVPWLVALYYETLEPQSFCRNFITWARLCGYTVSFSPYFHLSLSLFHACREEHEVLVFCSGYSVCCLYAAPSIMESNPLEV